MSNRFFQIQQFIDQIKPSIITEVGIDDFSVTERMIDKTLANQKQVVFFGLGLAAVVQSYESKLLKIKEKNNEFNYFLIDLSQNINVQNEYVVGGKTIKITDTELVFCNDINDPNDFMSCLQVFQNCECIILNNFYQTNDEVILAKSLNPVLSKIKHLILPVVDTKMVDLELVNVQLVITGKILQKITAQNQPAQSQNTENMGNNNQVNIKTKNAVPNEQIQKHVEENILFARQMHIKEILPCQIHNGVAYMIGGAPSYKSPDKLKLIRKAQKEPNHYIFSSKTSINFLLENNIKPYACILLDPREHIPTFVEGVNKDVIYFVASQCNPDTIKSLFAQGAKVFLYHAAVNAGEGEVLKRLKTPSPLVGGGSTSVTRGIGLLQIMGFYQFKLFGIDSSYPSKPKKVHGYNQEKPAIEVNMSDSGSNTTIGQKYWTDPELIAQCNDIEMIMKNWFNIKIENYSEGMMGDMFKHLLAQRRNFKDFMKK